MSDDNRFRYDDIIDLPHHQSSTRAHMSMLNRAAQFSPFAALTGYDAEIRETARETEREVELSDDEAQAINRTLTYAAANSLELKITFFVPDAKKAGGAYRTHTGCIRRVDDIRSVLILTDRFEISIGSIVNAEIIEK